jgi:homoserine kinase
MDNIGASLYGGVILARPAEKKVIKIGVLMGMTVILATPDFPLMTKRARKILPKKIEMSRWIQNMSNSCAMVLGICRNDQPLFGRAISDVVIEPFRSKLIPGFYEVKNAALKNGALGCSISGAGSTLFAVTDRPSSGEAIGQAMKKEFLKKGFDCVITLTQMDVLGARVVKG